MTSWHWFDYVIVGIISLSVLTGLFRGFVKELIALCVWVIAVWLSFVYAKSVAIWLAPYIQDTSARVVLAYAIIVVGTLIVGGMFNALLSFIMHRSGLSGTDRLLGLGFGLVRGVFVVSLIIVVMQLTAMPEEEYRKKSLFYAYFTPMVKWLSQYTPDIIKRVEGLEHKSNPDSKPKSDIVVKDFGSL